MSYVLTVGGQVYVFDSKSEYNEVKEMSVSEQKAYIVEHIDEDSLCLLEEETSDETSTDSTDESEESSSSETYSVDLETTYLQQIQELKDQQRSVYNSLCQLTPGDSENFSTLCDEAENIGTQLEQVQNEYLAYLVEQEGGSTTSTGTHSSSLTGSGTSGSDIVAGAEQYLGANNPSRKAGENPFVRIQRGGSCDDFTTYVIDHSVSEDNLADWYKNLSENQKAWGPDIFRAAKKAGATVSASEAKAGDIAIVNFNGHGGGDHTVIVKEIKDGVLYAIDSRGGKVQNRTYDLDDVCTIARVTK